jgi:prophage regulatory protein
LSRILRYWELSDHGVPWSRQHIYKLEKDGRFPRRVKLGDQTVGWLDFEIDALVDGRIGARGDPGATADDVKERAEL